MKTPLGRAKIAATAALLMMTAACSSSGGFGGGASATSSGNATGALTMLVAPSGAAESKAEA